MTAEANVKPTPKPAAAGKPATSEARGAQAGLRHTERRGAQGVARAYTVTVKTYITEYLGYLSVERGASQHTIAAYGRDLAEYDAFLSARGVAGPDALSRDDVTAFVALAVGAWSRAVVGGAQGRSHQGLPQVPRPRGHHGEPPDGAGCRCPRSRSGCPMSSRSTTSTGCSASRSRTARRGCATARCSRRSTAAGCG